MAVNAGTFAVNQQDFETWFNRVLFDKGLREEGECFLQIDKKDIKPDDAFSEKTSFDKRHKIDSVLVVKDSATNHAQADKQNTLKTIAFVVSSEDAVNSIIETFNTDRIPHQVLIRQSRNSDNSTSNANITIELKDIKFKSISIIGMSGSTESNTRALLIFNGSILNYQIKYPDGNIVTTDKQGQASSSILAKENALDTATINNIITRNLSKKISNINKESNFNNGGFEIIYENIESVLSGVVMTLCVGSGEQGSNISSVLTLSNITLLQHFKNNTNKEFGQIMSKFKATQNNKGDKQNALSKIEFAFTSACGAKANTQNKKMTIALENFKNTTNIFMTDEVNRYEICADHKTLKDKPPMIKIKALIGDQHDGNSTPNPHHQGGMKVANTTLSETTTK